MREGHRGLGPLPSFTCIDRPSMRGVTRPKARDRCYRLSAQRRQRYRANSSVSSPVSGSITVWPIVTQPSLQAWGRSSWWSCSLVDGCAGCAVDSFMAASSVGCPASGGASTFPRGHFQLTNHNLPPCITKRNSVFLVLLNLVLYLEVG